MNTATNTNSQAAANFYKAAQETMIALALRWRDESQYEDIADYKTPLIPIAAQHGVIIEKMTKRPFGCEFVVDGKRFTLKVKLSTGIYQYRRVA